MKTILLTFILIICGVSVVFGQNDQLKIDKSKIDKSKLIIATNPVVKQPIRKLDINLKDVRNTKVDVQLFKSFLPDLEIVNAEWNADNQTLAVRVENTGANKTESVILAVTITYGEPKTTPQTTQTGGFGKPSQSDTVLKTYYTTIYAKYAGLDPLPSKTGKNFNFDFKEFQEKFSFCKPNDKSLGNAFACSANVFGQTGVISLEIIKANSK